MPKWFYKKIDGLTSDQALLKVFSRGQTDAFDRLYTRHKRGLFLFIFRQCQNRAIAEEIAHDTWLAVITQASQYKSKAKFSTWLFKIAHNRLVDHWRKHGNASHVLLDEVSDFLISKDSSAEEIQTLKGILESLEQLPPEQTEVVLLRIEGFSYAEISNITNTKQETVKSRLRYANKSLRGISEAQA